MTSSIPGFYKKGRQERLDAVRGQSGMSEGDAGQLSRPDGGLRFEDADRMVENALGTFALPLGVATNFAVNGREHLVPMAIEEPSIIAAASRAAKLARPGGFTASADAPLLAGQIQVLGAGAGAEERVMAGAQEILDTANSRSRSLPKAGRGAKEVSCRRLETDEGQMLIVEITVDTGDAMGANVTNTMCEAAAPVVERLSGGRVLLRILSNYSVRRLARASAVFSAGGLGGPDVVDDILSAYQLARHDVYRAVTHNKGIMNGIVSVANATGQDGRAIEAAAHAWAARSGTYTSMSEWRKGAGGDLEGTLEIPLAVGTVGGVANVHPAARACLAMIGAGSAQELACVMVSAGLAQNLAAMAALATDGIQKGHMRLHASNLAAAAGASGAEADRIAAQMAAEGDISAERARQLARADQ